MNINSAIRDLQNAVYYVDARGRYASLPDNNSMRIDLLSGRLDQLNKKIDETGGVSISDLNKVVQYLDGSHTISEFNPPTGDIINTKNDDPHKNEYVNVKNALQLIYDNEVNENTGIVADENDPYIITTVSDFPKPSELTEEQYRSDMSRSPNVFPYMYTQIRFIYDKLFKRESNFNVFSHIKLNSINASL